MHYREQTETTLPQDRQDMEILIGYVMAGKKKDHVTLEIDVDSNTSTLRDREIARRGTPQWSVRCITWVDVTMGATAPSYMRMAQKTKVLEQITEEGIENWEETGNENRSPIPQTLQQEWRLV